jgi:hypothetical protein
MMQVVLTQSKGAISLGVSIPPDTWLMGYIPTISIYLPDDEDHCEAIDP